MTNVSLCYRPMALSFRDPRFDPPFDRELELRRMFNARLIDPVSQVAPEIEDWQIPTRASGVGVWSQEDVEEAKLAGVDLVEF